MKLVPREADGQIKDRIDPYAVPLNQDGVNPPNAVGQNYFSSSGLAPGWIRFELDKCQIQPSQSKKTCFKMFVNRDEESKSEKEQRFFGANVCSRTVWVKKLLQAKNRSFEAEDCYNVPVEELITLQNQIEDQQRGARGDI